MGLNRYKYLVRTYATLYYLGADRVPGAARHTGWCARAAPLSPGSVTAGSWHSVAGYLAVLPIAHVGYLRAATGLHVPVRLDIFVACLFRLGIHLLPPWDFTADLFYGNSYPQYVL